MLPHLPILAIKWVWKLLLWLWETMPTNSLIWKKESNLNFPFEALKAALKGLFHTILQKRNSRFPPVVDVLVFQNVPQYNGGENGIHSNKTLTSILDNAVKPRITFSSATFFMSKVHCSHNLFLQYLHVATTAWLSLEKILVAIKEKVW